MKIAIGNDHAAVELKKTIMEYVESMGHEVTNFGTDSSESCNYRSMVRRWLMQWHRASLTAEY